jgi:hypothetical protein
MQGKTLVEPRSTGAAGRHYFQKPRSRRVLEEITRRAREPARKVGITGGETARS